MVTIDNVNYDFPANAGTIYQFCYEKNIVLPCFCYHEKLSIAGNCRMCLVEANGALAVSCAIPVLDNMQVITKSQRLLHARESVLEFLLINHPLDCPICDQGGECDLQDISMSFGLDRGRFYEIKKSVDNLNCCGPLIKTVMTRCIHCTRCVRFLNEYSDVFDLGVLGRGSAMEIGTYLEKFTLDALSGNIIDLCPVGALTSMPYAFTARPWELKTVESIDVLDALASSIRIDVANNQVVRISPLLLEAVNEDWLTNKARFSYDALSLQRLYYPKFSLQNQVVSLSWLRALSLFLENLAQGSWALVEATIGYFTDLETMWGLKNFFNSFGCNNISYEDSYSSYVSSDFRFSFLLNLTLAELEEMSFIILLNTNPRLENPLVNSRLRKSFLKSRGQLHKTFTVISFGQALNYANYPIHNLGNNIQSFLQFIQGKYYFFNNIFFNPARFSSLSFFNVFLPHELRPALLVGSSALALRRDISETIKAALHFAQLLRGQKFLNQKIFNVLSTHLGELSLKELGARPQSISSNTLPNFKYFLGTGRFKATTSNDFIIFQGSHMPQKLSSSSKLLLLPTTTYVERCSTYINLEGRIRTTKIAVAAPGLVLSDLEVLRLLNILKEKIIPSNFSFLENFHETMEFFKFTLNYKCCFLGTLQKSLDSFRQSQGFKLRAFCSQSPASFKPYLLHLLTPLNAIKLAPGPLNKIFINYYNTDFLTRHSKIMGLCSLRLVISTFSDKS